MIINLLLYLGGWVLGYCSIMYVRNLNGSNYDKLDALVSWTVLWTLIFLSQLYFFSPKA